MEDHSKRDIETIEDIRILVNHFYDRVRQDELLGPVFEGRIKNNWSKHLETMYRFWETILLGNYSYKGSPFTKHADLPVDKMHFDRWLELFYATIEEHFKGEKADEAKWRAQQMGGMFLYKIEYMRQTGHKILK